MSSRFRIPPSFASGALLLALTASPGLGQALGTVALNAALADASAQVVGVLNRNPEGNAFLAYCEGPAMDSQGNLFFTEQFSTFRIWKVTAQGQASIFNTGNKSNGIEFDPQGRMAVAQAGAIATFDANGARTVLTMTGNPDIKEANDLSIGSNGGIWFTNHGSGNSFFYRSPSGAVTAYANGSSPMGVRVPNGIEWIEEKDLLLVCSSEDNKVYQYTVGDNGALSNKRDFASMPVPDGLTVDEMGNVYVASWSLGIIHVFGPTGAEMGKVTVKSANTSDNNQNGNTSNCIIGPNKVLYITGDGGLYKVQLKVGPRVRPGTTGTRGGLFRVDPAGLRLSRSVFDPSSQGLSIALPVGGGRFAVSIYDVRMREVWNAPAGDAGLEWDGRDAAGERLPSGRYLILAQSAGGRKALAAPVDLVRR